MISVTTSLLKIPSGGWFPIAVGTAIFVLMRVWREGRLRVTERMQREERTVEGCSSAYMTSRRLV